MQVDAVQHCPSAYVVDGDTLRCGSIRLRLLGIDAPELPGHCARYRECAPGDGFSSKRSLIAALRNGRVGYSIVTTDRFGRYVVMAWAGRVTCPVGSFNWLRRSISPTGTTAASCAPRAGNGHEPTVNLVSRILRRHIPARGRYQPATLTSLRTQAQTAFDGGVLHYFVLPPLSRQVSPESDLIRF